MSKFLNSVWGKLVLVVLAGLAIRLLAYGFIKAPWIIFDEFIYLDTARQIVRGEFISALWRDPQLYPAGWPLLMATVAGFLKNPDTQYRVILFFNMLLSSFVPVLAFFLTGSLGVAVLISVFPPLFVYSSSIMSESLYTLMLFLVLVVSKYIIRDDLKKTRSLILAAVILGLLLYATRRVRSVGLVLIPAFVLTGGVIAFLQFREKSLNTLKNTVFFVVLAVFAYYLWEYLGRHTLFPDRDFYQRTPYIKSLIKALSRPLYSLTLIRNELTISLFFSYFILPFFLLHQTVKQWHKKEWHLLFPRIFAFFVFVGTLVLTFAHMFIGTSHNPQYLVFSRYLDPVLVVLFALMLGDFWSYLQTKSYRLKLPLWVYPIVGYFLFYFVFRIPRLDYKFGNTMPIYFFLKLFESPLSVWAVVILVVVAFYALARNQRTLLLVSFLVLFSLTSWFSIGETRNTPQWVAAKYQITINDWQIVAKSYRAADVALCIHRDGVSSELY